MSITRRKVKKSNKPRITRRKTVENNAKKVVRAITRRSAAPDAPVEFISSGSTTLNLSLSGKGRKGGWARARVVNIIGDGSSGKTLLALEAAFWAWKNIKKVKSKIFPKVKKIIIVYNNCEGVMDFPIKQMYGEEFYNAVTWICTKRIEQMGRDYIRRLMALNPGTFLMYIIDSWDALTAKAGQDRLEESIEKDEEVKGSFHLEKQRYGSAFFADVAGRMENNALDSTLFIISQVRTKIGSSWGKKTYRAGGKALDFYTHQVAWIREVEKLRKTRKGNKRVYGIRGEAKVERSKVAKPFRESEFTILFDYGLDDLSSMMKYLWGSKKTITWERKKYSREKFIKYVEKNNLEPEIMAEVEDKWDEIEDAFTADVKKRKRRY